MFHKGGTSPSQQSCEMGDLPVSRPKLVDPEGRALPARPHCSPETGILVCKSVPWRCILGKLCQSPFSQRFLFMPKRYHWPALHNQWLVESDSQREYWPKPHLRKILPFFVATTLGNTNIYFWILMMISLQYSACYLDLLKHYNEASSVKRPANNQDEHNSFLL